MKEDSMMAERARMTATQLADQRPCCIAAATPDAIGTA